MSGRRALAPAAVVAAVVVAADQLSKVAARASGGRSTGDVVPVRNPGFLGGLGGASGAVVAAAAVAGLVAFGGVLARRVRHGRTDPRVAGLVVGGAVGNLVDRIALGSVRDFLVVHGWVINLADIAVLAGAACLVAAELRRIPVVRPTHS